ncbi:hypothetical protein F2Q69_00038747 [Brassica cretica]|uniref:RNase H type-1 domain-containing protein n=1 Tax=Brassica cretica TaxID=69181 RepID=A0A8S9SP86_BRACR|nr:hypothetical protein F2Q69_00038747 [Brassica cretica]
MLRVVVSFHSHLPYKLQQGFVWAHAFLPLSRNDFLLNGVRWNPLEIVLKARSESEEWALAQLVDKEVSSEMEITKPQSKKRWSPPIVGWLMCNVALEWDKQRRVLGVAWVVQNHRGVVPKLFLAVKKPHEWPALRYRVEEMGRLLGMMKDYHLKVVSTKENRGASFIAQSD